MFTYSFEKLEVWKESIQLVKDIYMLSKGFPTDERFGLTSQMKRAIVSIASNISEETSRHTNKDKAHFTSIAYSSTLELLNQLIITKELGFITNKRYTFKNFNNHQYVKCFAKASTQQINKSTYKQ